MSPHCQRAGGQGTVAAQQGPSWWPRGALVTTMPSPRGTVLIQPARFLPCHIQGWQAWGLSGLRLGRMLISWGIYWKQDFRLNYGVIMNWFFVCYRTGQLATGHNPLCIKQPQENLAVLPALPSASIKHSWLPVTRIKLFWPHLQYHKWGATGWSHQTPSAFSSLTPAMTICLCTVVFLSWSDTELIDTQILALTYQLLAVNQQSGLLLNQKMY